MVLWPEIQRRERAIMKNRMLYVLGIGLLAITSLSATEKVLTPEEAISANGTRISMQGVVTEVVRKDSGYVYVNVGGKYPDHTFAVQIHKMEVDQFPDLESWIGRNMTFSGIVEVFKEKPSIRIRKPTDANSGTSTSPNASSD